MSSRSSISEECYLLTNISLNSERIGQILDRRFTSNSHRTSFDFKAFVPEQPSNNAKVSRSLLRFYPRNDGTTDDEEHASSDGSASEDDVDEEVEAPNNDNYLNELAEWEPDTFLAIVADDDDEVDEQDLEEHGIQATNVAPETEGSDMDCSSDTATTQVEDLLVTFVHRPLKMEPINRDGRIFHNPSQLDGQVDIFPDQPSTSAMRRIDERFLYKTIAKVNANRSVPLRTTKLIHGPLPPTDRPSSNHRAKKPRTDQTPKRSRSIPTHRDSTKEKTIQYPKSKKKPTPMLLPSVLKRNQSTIRPLLSNVSSRPVTTGRSPPLASGLHSKSPQHKNLKHMSIKPSHAAGEPSSMKKPAHLRHLHESQRSFSLPKEKHASEHMTLAEKKLTHFQHSQRVKVSTPNTPTSNHMAKTSAVTPTFKPKEMSKKQPQTLQKPTVNPHKMKSPSKNLHSSHGQQVSKKKKKKKKKVKRLESEHINPVPHSRSSPPPLPKIQKRIENRVFTNQKLNKLPAAVSIDLLQPVAPTKQRPGDFFDGCIVLDDDDDDNNNGESDYVPISPNSIQNEEDDDIQEIERQRYSIAYNIRTREKLLDNAIRSSVMRIKWLMNLEYLLLEHILICNQENSRPSTHAYETSFSIKCEPSLVPISVGSYHIDPSLLSIVMINFIKIFVLRNSLNDQQDLSFVQMGFTSHLRYLLIELPTYNHPDDKNVGDHCSHCYQYSLILNILFDLLFDFIEHDLCEIPVKDKYRSSLIEDDYFNQFQQSKSSKRFPFYRIKLMIYFIELIGMHIRKCSNRKQFQFNKNENKLFHSIEDFLRHLLRRRNDSTHEQISICLNVMELCLLFVQERERRMEQMALFIVQLCEDDLSSVTVFLFNGDLLADIRLLMINELIGKKFLFKLNSRKSLDTFARTMEAMLNEPDPIDEYAFLLLRSLLNTYADLIIDIKPLVSLYSTCVQELVVLLRNELKSICVKLLNESRRNDEYAEQIKRTVTLYHLLKYKWNRL